MGDAQGSFRLVKRRQEVVVPTFWIEARQITLNQRCDSVAVAVDCVDDDGEFGGDG